MAAANPGSSGLKTINKLARRSKYIKKHQRGIAHNQYDKTFKNPQLLEESPRANELVRKYQRRLDRSLGNDAVAQKPTLRQVWSGCSLTRVVYLTGHAIQITLSNTLEEGYKGSGTIVGDLVEIIEQGNAYQGQYFKVLYISSPTVVLVTDIPAFTGTETGVTVAFEQSTVTDNYY